MSPPNTTGDELLAALRHALAQYSACRPRCPRAHRTQVIAEIT